MEGTHVPRKGFLLGLEFPSIMSDVSVNRGNIQTRQAAAEKENGPFSLSLPPSQLCICLITLFAMLKYISTVLKVNALFLLSAKRNSNAMRVA